MASPLQFQDHETFHEAFLRMAAAGIAASLACDLLSPAIGVTDQTAASPWRLGITAAAVVAAGVWPHLARMPRVVIGFLGVLLATAMIILVSGAPMSGLGAAVLGGAVVAAGLRGKLLAVAIALSAAMLGLGGLVFTRLGVADLIVAWPSAIAAATIGFAFAAVAVMSQLPRHLVILPDRVGSAHAAASARARGEVKDLADRGLSLWRKTEDSLPAGDAHRDILEEAVHRLLDVARHWTAVEAESDEADATSLQARIDDLEARMAAATDSVVQGQYQSARDALREQLRYLEGIDTSRERVLARMHNYLAAMERLRLALINVKSTSASRSAVDIQPMVDSLADMGRDIEALDEVQRS